MLSEFIKEKSLDHSFIKTAKDYFIPLAEKLAKNQKQHFNLAKTSSYSEHSKTYFVGINGCQGSGKSTLVDFLAKYLEQNHHVCVAVLSLDDFYLSRSERNKLAMNVHPLFKTRGVPGTHDTTLLTKTLSDLKNNRNSGVSLPRFNKAKDEIFPSKYWPVVDTAVDIVLFEGWCWGVPAQQIDDLALSVNELESKQDQQLIWRTKVNNILLTDYQPLYKLMDTWIMLKAPSFECVYQWRLEQEHKLSDSHLDRPPHNDCSDNIMSDEQVAMFILYYQRLTEYGLEVLPSEVDLLFELDNQRKIIVSKGL